MAKKCCNKWKKTGKCCSSCPIAKKVAKLDDHQKVKVKKHKKKSDEKKSDKKSDKKKSGKKKSDKKSKKHKKKKK